MTFATPDLRECDTGVAGISREKIARINLRFRLADRDYPRSKKIVDDSRNAVYGRNSRDASGKEGEKDAFEIEMSDPIFRRNSRRNVRAHFYRIAFYRC